MAETFRQLGHLFLQTVPTIVLVFALFLILDRIFFRPLSAVMKQREEMTVGALARAREQVKTAEAKAGEYEAAFQAARQEVYRQREADRRVNVEQRDAALRTTREQAEALTHKGQTELADAVTRAKTELDAACLPLAEEISQELIGPESFSGGSGRPQL